jgi:hypothetical protein
MHGLHPGLLVKSAAWLVGVGITLVAFSCDPELSLEQALEGKPCRAEGSSCFRGYVCAMGVCVLDTGSPEAAPDLGPPTTDAGGADGSETNGDGMDTMSSDVPDAADATPSCIRQVLFRDRDGDHFGSGEGEPRCPSEGWVPQGGDCLDTDDSQARDVHPGQLAFFAEGYPRPDQPGEISFDYDCSGFEEADPANTRAAPGDETDCNSASPGFVCASLNGMRTVLRAGASVNAECGSKILLTCERRNSQCVSGSVDRTSDPSRCH